jgi:hypothetical protein
MAKRSKRKAFGVTKKLGCDKHKCLKKKKAGSLLRSVKSGIKHLRVNNSGI